MNQPKTICDAFARAVTTHPERLAFRDPSGAALLDWKEYGEQVAAVAASLRGLGLQRGDRMAMMLPNCVEFYVLDMAAQHLGAAPYSIYNTLAPPQIAHQIADAEPRILICDRDKLPAVEACGIEPEVVIVLDDDAESLQSLAAHGADEEFSLERDAAMAKSDDLLTLIYTSGTTGPPKGVEITHANALAAAAGLRDTIDFPDPTAVVSYLPTAHIAERSISLYTAALLGFTVTVFPDARQVIDGLPSARPHWFFAVPRIYEKLRAATVAGAEEPLRARLDPAGPPLGEEEAAVLRTKIGLDRARALNSGGAPLMPEVIGFFHHLGLPLGELWGMSETTGAGTINRGGAIRPGTAGPAMPQVEIRIEPDSSELQARGTPLSPGYWRRPDLTAESRTEDGWLRTGDLGRIDDDGYLTIVGRAKEIIISSAGKNMSPANIEAELKGSSLLIGQAMVVGNARPYNVALIVLDPDAAATFAAEHGLDGHSPEELLEQPALETEIAAAVERANARLSRVEGIKRYRVLAEEWPPDGDELTPTMKLKRPAILEKYAAVIEELYATVAPS